MFPFGIFPFNILPQFNPWWPLQAKKLEELTPPLFKEYTESYAAWAGWMSKGNPWLAVYNSMLEAGSLSQFNQKK